MSLASERFPLESLAAPIFVFIWSTGFIIARFGMPYMEPATFLFIRFTGVLIVMGIIILFWKPVWPNRSQTIHIAIAVWVCDGRMECCPFGDDCWIGGIDCGPATDLDRMERFVGIRAGELPTMARIALRDWWSCLGGC